MQRLGIRERPEYEGREYYEQHVERYEITVYIAKSEYFPNITDDWSMTAIGFRFIDTYQVVTCKALRHLCQLYDEPISRTPMRFFPPPEKNHPAWNARVEALQVQGGSPTLKLMTEYLLALDEKYDKQAAKLRNCITYTMEAEVYARRLHVYYAETQARVTIVESHETTLAKALRIAEERHTEQLRIAYLVTRPKRRMLAANGQEPTILDGIPVDPPEQRMDPTIPSAPPPSEVSDVEPLLPLTQPPSREEGDPRSTTVGGPKEPHHEALCLDDVD
jgi:hypothetical protein